jgi:DNA-binding MarR family transcriptional regulator
MQQSSRRIAATALLELGIAVTRLVRAEVARSRATGLTLVEVRALSIAEAMPALPLKDLALYMGLTPATVSRLAKRLVRRGLLRRHADAADRRRALFRPSRKGSAALVAARRDIETLLELRLEGLAADQLAELRRVSRMLLPRLAADWNRES